MSDAAIMDAPATVKGNGAQGNVAVIPRNLRFVHASGAAGDPAAATWLGGDKVATAVFNALSLTFPDGERMFMDAVRHYKGELSGQLLEEANAFITQEAIHTREHVMMNKIMEGGHYPLDKIRAHIRSRTAIAEGLGPMAMLASTISLEHFTAMLGDMILNDSTMLNGAPEEMRLLWQWHALEETEHKAVAYDVFNVATKDWSTFKRYQARVHAMIFITFQFTANIVTYASDLLVADGMGRFTAVRKVLWFLFGKPGFFRTGWKDYFSWYKVNFHPWDHDNRPLLEKWRAVFGPTAAAE